MLDAYGFKLVCFVLPGILLLMTKVMCQSFFSRTCIQWLRFAALRMCKDLHVPDESRICRQISASPARCIEKCIHNIMEGSKQWEVELERMGLFYRERYRPEKNMLLYCDKQQILLMVSVNLNCVCKGCVCVIASMGTQSNAIGILCQHILDNLENPSLGPNAVTM